MFRSSIRLGEVTQLSAFFQVRVFTMTISETFTLFTSFLYQSAIVKGESEQVLHVFIITVEDQIAMVQSMWDKIKAASGP